MPQALSRDIHPCHKCRRPTHLRLLDGKDDGTGDFTILECQDCYGPDWLPVAQADLLPNSEPQRLTRAARGSA
jgi:hypothetical protein